MLPEKLTSDRQKVDDSDGEVSRIGVGSDSIEHAKKSRN